MIALVKLEQKYLNLFEYKYNINPMTGKSKLGFKYLEATK